MRRVVAWTAAAFLAGGLIAEAGMARAIVADLPYARVWELALRAVEGYPVERAADGVIVTGRTERPPRAGEEGFERVAERATLRIEAVATSITRITIEVEAEGWRQEAWIPIPDTDVTARAIMTRLRAAPG